MMEFTQNNEGQQDIINRIKILAKQGSDKIHEAIPIEYQKISL